MKVKELIEKLKDFDRDWECFTDLGHKTISLFLDEDKKRIYIETSEYNNECEHES